MSRSWHFARWGPLGWTETALKLCAICIAVVTWLSGGSYERTSSAAGVAATAVLILATVGLIGAIVDRLIERELVSIVFVLLNVIGHGAATWLALHLPHHRTAIVAFCVLMAAGDVVKIVFLRTSGFTVRTVPTNTLVTMTGVYVGLYVVAALLSLAA